MRKWIALILAVVMLFGLLSVSAQAAEATIQDKYGQMYTLSQPWLEESSYDDGTMMVSVYHITPDTKITLPGDSGVTYLVFSVLSVSDMGDVDECSRELPGGTTFAAREFNTSTMTGKVYESNYALVCSRVGDAAGEAFQFNVEWNAQAPGGEESLDGETSAEETPAAENPFTDVAETAYYYEPVLWAVENGITTGKTETAFAPGETCTTAHILTFLWRANGCPEPGIINNPFTDVEESDYFCKAAVWAAEKELVSGNVFSPSAPCTRGQTMLYLYLLAGSPEAELSTFSDVPADSVYSKAISWAVAQGITTGKTETTFAPDEICTRGHIATFLYRAASGQ